MGVNTVADGERPRPAQQKGGTVQGEKSWLLPATLSSFVVYSLHYRTESPHQRCRQNIRNSALVTDIFNFSSCEIMLLFLCFEMVGGGGKKNPKCYLHE